ncbi:MAG: transcriptional repressor [Calditrichaeota bacterium]|nr:MAG: transcriptional repressor [Calditrichota bacterium]
MNNAISILKECGVQPTPQRIAVLNFIMQTDTHPSADQVLENVRNECPTVSRATVYNTLNLLVRKGLLQTQILREGTVVFDRNVNKHHHFIDLDTGEIYDIPWDALTVIHKKSLENFEVEELQVVLKGRKKVK